MEIMTHASLCSGIGFDLSQKSLLSQWLNILVTCEYSGTIRDAFENAGWNAWSCDLLPTESEQTKASGKHIQGDCLEVIKYSISKADRKLNPFIDDTDNEFWVPKFNLMIAHPPCTYLSFAYTGKERYSINRLQEKIGAYQFFLDLWKAPIEHICIENPFGYAHTGLLPCSQIIEPYYFGDPYKKRTCLWLKNLPELKYYKDDLFEKGTMTEPTHLFVGCSPKRKRKLPVLISSGQKERSKFHPGIAKAMAQQWTEYINNNLNK